jgi:protein subunit release factor A
MCEKCSKVLKAAVSAIYFADSHDYSSALWDIVRETGGEEAAALLEEDGQEAYDKYCEGE